MNSNFQEEKVNTRLQLIQLFKGIWPFISRHPFLLTGALTFTIIHIISARLLPISIGIAIDQGIKQKNMSLFIKIAIGYSIVQIIHTLSQFLYSYSFASLGNKTLQDLRAALLDHVQRLPLTYFNQNPTGRLVNRLTYDPSNLQEIFTDGLIHILVQFFVLVSIIIAMSLVSWKLALIAMLTVPFFIYLALQITQQLRLHQRESKKQMGQISAYITERLQGLKTLQALSVLLPTFSNFKQLSQGYQNITLDVIKTSARLHPVLNLASAFIIASLLIASGYFSFTESLSIGAITTLILHAQDFVHPLRDILERYQMFQNSLTSAERVFPVFQEASELYQKKSDSSQLPSGQIDLVNLSFRYQESLPWILENINLTIPAGQKVALVGKTGAGKSTLIGLIQKFYSPTQGQILLDQDNISSWPVNQIREQIGVIQQDPFVFRGTLKENITLGNPDITDEKILSTMAHMGVRPYFDKKSMPLSFWIEEKGQNISLGERQLINFIRIFIFNPAILVFDEATANMDSATESILQNSFAQMIKNRTTIIIAHRLSTLQICDQVYLVGHGQVSAVDLNTIIAQPELLH